MGRSSKRSDSEAGYAMNADGDGSSNSGQTGCNVTFALCSAISIAALVIGSIALSNGNTTWTTVQSGTGNPTFATVRLTSSLTTPHITATNSTVSNATLTVATVTTLTATTAALSSATATTLQAQRLQVAPPQTALAANTTYNVASSLDGGIFTITNVGNVTAVLPVGTVGMRYVFSVQSGSVNASDALITSGVTGGDVLIRPQTNDVLYGTIQNAGTSTIGVPYAVSLSFVNGLATTGDTIVAQCTAPHYWLVSAFARYPNAIAHA